MESPRGVQVKDVSVEEVWTRLQSDQDAILVDVRTRAEWTYVGVPDLSRIAKRPLLIEWQSFPDGKVDPAFADRLSEMLAGAGVAKDAEVFFICRSGGRSKMAAQAMTAGGYTRCRNVADGFEGPLDTDRHRSRLAGWKAAGLPWVQG